MENSSYLTEITGSTTRESLSIQSNYRFDALIRAIDFFSQKFNMDMLIEFAGDFINEVLTLGASALFIYNEDNNCFKATKLRLYSGNIQEIKNSQFLQDIARLHGAIITKKFELFFDDDFLEEYKPSLLIPLIHDNGLMGFIVTSGKAIDEFDDDDLSMASALMRLFNNAFERNRYIGEIEVKNKRLDSITFELNTVNKTSKVLFSEINLEKLLTTGLEIFSEVSGSIITAFAVKDHDLNALVVKAYKDVRTHQPLSPDFRLEFQDNPHLDKDKYFFDVDKELDELSRVFKNPEAFNELNAEYVVLIVKETILGFVTLGKIKAVESYTLEMLELVSSLAISCFIALNNAMMFKEILAQMEDLERRYNNLLRLTYNA